MEARPGYKRTEVGLIPEDWQVLPVLRVGDTKRGAGSQYIKYRASGGVRLIRINDFFEDTPVFVEPTDAIMRYVIHERDLLFAGTGASAGASYLPKDDWVGLPHSYNAPRIRISESHSKEYILYSLQSPYVSKQQKASFVGGAQPFLDTKAISNLLIATPSTISEQRAIAWALGDVDVLISALEKLIAKKRDLKQAAMQQLLTGQTRLPGFRGEWVANRIAEIATPSSERNTVGDSLPVLTCSKHLGFMDSLAFFKNQVFSKDLSTYKTIRRGQIGYPANHIEEGSIGLQNLYDIALVSPIYIVFTVAEHINSSFLHALLKLDSYRQKFKTATTSSVERRGSLRWRAFSEITVRFPPLPEQTAIAGVLSDMDSEIGALEQRLSKTRALKQGMMQELLTGRIRLV